MTARALVLTSLLLAAVTASAQEQQITCADINLLVYVVETEGSPVSPLVDVEGLATPAQWNLARAALECAAESKVAAIRDAGVDVCDVHASYFAGTRSDPGAPKWTDYARLVVKANLVILANACTAERERMALLAEVDRLKTDAVIYSRMLSNAQAAAAAVAPAAPVAPPAPAPQAESSDSEAAAEIRGLRNDIYSDRMIDSFAERQREDRYREERQRERAEDAKRDRAEARRREEQSQREADERERRRNPGHPGASRLDGYLWP